MRKNFYLSGLFLCILALCVCGCGGGSAADPMGTGTVQFIDVSGSVIETASVVPNGTITLRAKVSNLRSDGTAVPVVNEQVSFSLVNSGNGASLTVVNTRTSSSGIATALFTSGNSMYSDVVQVTTSVGATATIHINKTGGLTEPGIKTLTASSTTVVAGQTSVVTANVVDGTGSPVMNVPVWFAIPVNGSNAVFSNHAVNYLTYTDVSGNATVVYTAGSGNPYSDVYDSVQATLVNGSSTAVEIKRTKATLVDLSITLAAAPASVAALQTSIITATVTGDNKSGAAVTFTIPVNASGASFNAGGTSVSSITVPASGSGSAMVIYQAGSASPGTAVQDTIQAVLANGANAAIILTRTATMPSVYTVSIAASSTSVTAGQVSVITATVTSTSGTTTINAAGVPVSFTLPVNSSGAFLSVGNATTDASGKAVVIYQPGSTTVTVQDTVQAAVGTAVSAVAITVKGSSKSAFSISIAANPSTLTTSTSNSIITANVKNNAGDVISGVTVNFVTTTGTLSPGSATTDGSGNAVVTYTGDGSAAAHTAVVTAIIAVDLNTYRAAAVINYPLTTGTTPTAISIAVAASPTSVTAGQTSIITATLTGNNIAGVAVTFTLPVNNSGATLNGAATATATTDGSGKAVVIYQPGVLTPAVAVQDTVQAAAGTATAATTVTRTASAASAMTVAIAAAPTSVPAGQVSIITATVTSTSGGATSPAAGVAVTFTLPVNNSGATLTPAAPATVTTDGSGKAIVIYTPGALTPALTVQDTVQAAVGTATAAVVITRTVSAASTTTVSVAPSPATVTTGQVSIITATVTTTSGGSSTPAGGVTVNFSLLAGGSGGTLSALTATTNSSGQAAVVYTPGTTNPDRDVQDVVQADYTTVSSATVITRTARATLAYSIDVASSATLLATDSSSAVITANVKKLAGSVPVSGVTVTFTVTGGTNAGGTALTDGAGNAVYVYTGNGAAGQSIVVVSITFGADTYTDALIITKP